MAKTVEESLVLSRPICQDAECTSVRPERKHILRIRKDMDVTVYIPPYDEAEKRALSEENRSFYQTFNLLSINEHIFPEDPVWPQYEQIQANFYQNILLDESLVELVKPDGSLRQLEKQKRKKDYEAVESVYQNTITSSPQQQKRQKNTSDYQVLRETKPDEFGNSMFWELGRPISPTAGPASTADKEKEKTSDKDGLTEELLLELMMEVNTANRQVSIQVCGCGFNY